MKEFRTRKNIGMPIYDYSMDGWYYVTICARDKENIFGNFNPDIVGADGCIQSCSDKADQYIARKKI